jgi:hypothetical protein
VIIAFVNEFRQISKGKHLAGMAMSGKLKVDSQLYVHRKNRTILSTIKKLSKNSCIFAGAVQVGKMAGAVECLDCCRRISCFQHDP